MGSSLVFFSNPAKPETVAVQNETMQVAMRQGYRAFALTPDVVVPADVLADMQFLVSIGGDGTILKSIPFAIAYDIPILGINLGRRGFLSEILPGDFAGALRLYESSSLHIVRHMMLACRVNGSEAGVCLNEIMLYKESFSGVAHISYSINHDDAGTVFCDGMIIGTPTGSTAYSMSAGGPIIAQGLDACVITPVCSHSLLARPIVAPPDALITFRMHGAGCLYADGQKLSDVGKNDEITVTRSEKTVGFLRYGKQNLFSLIKHKLT